MSKEKKTSEAREVSSPENNGKRKRPSPSPLRSKAERRLLSHPRDTESMTADQIKALVHELHVHQIELDMQNEELRRTHEETEVLLKKYYDLYNLAPVGFFTFDARGIITEVNSVGAKMLATPRHRLLGSGLGRFVAPDFQEIFYHYRSRLINTGEPTPFELKLIKKGGTTLWALVNMTRVAGTDDQPDEVRMSATDITSLKQAMQVFSDDRWQHGSQAAETHDVIDSIMKTLAGETANQTQDEVVRLTSEDEYRSQAEHTHDIHYSIDLQLNFERTGERWRQFGYTPSKLLATSFFDIVEGEYHDPLGQIFNRTITTGEPSSATHRLIDAHGESHWVENQIKARRDGTGSIIGITGVLRDMARVRMLQEALHQAADFSADLINSCPVAMIVFNTDKTVKYVNPAFESLTGYSLAEALGINVLPWWWVDTIITDSIPAVSPQSPDHVLPQKTLSFRHRTGTKMTVEITTIKVGKLPESVFYVSTWVDMTRRLRAENEARWQSEKIESLYGIAKGINEAFDLDQIMTGSLHRTLQMLDLRCGMVCHFNEAKTGIRSFTVVGIEPSANIEAINLDNANPSSQIIVSGEPVFFDGREALLTAMPPAIALALEQMDVGCGGIIPLYASDVLVGALIAIGRYGRLISSEEMSLLIHVGGILGKAIESMQLRDHASKIRALEHLEKFRMEFLANVSHELRTPLAAIKGFVTLLLFQEEKRNGPDLMEFLNIINQESDRLTVLINDLLQTAEITSENQVTSLRDIRPMEIMNLCWNRLTAIVDVSRLRVKIDEAMPAVPMDAERISQVISNLVENAVKHSGTDGEIEIEADIRDDCLVFSVIDFGVGIAPRHLEKIFDRFYQADRTVTGARKGTGLGLAVCKGIVEAHGGRIWAESKPGKGACFRFALPV